MYSPCTCIPCSRRDYCNSLLAGIWDGLINQSTADCDESGSPPGPPETQVWSNFGRHSWSSTLAPHPFKNRLQLGSSRLQVPPWYRSCIPHGDACTEINCSGPLRLCSTARGDLLVPRTKTKTIGPRSSALWNNLPDDFRDPSVLNNVDMWYSLNWH